MCVQCPPHRDGTKDFFVFDRVKSVHTSDSNTRNAKIVHEAFRWLSLCYMSFSEWYNWDIIVMQSDLFICIHTRGTRVEKILKFCFLWNVVRVWVWCTVVLITLSIIIIVYWNYNLIGIQEDWTLWHGQRISALWSEMIKWNRLFTPVTSILSCRTWHETTRKKNCCLHGMLRN